LISYATSRRVKEIGIRMALGAQPKEVLRLILRQGLGVIAAGSTAGVVASFFVTRLLAKLLFGVRAADPLTLASVVVGLSLIAFAAIYVPARRAARTDPVGALRCE
jgi:ABC-type antimicrobial peptide transport system permease subunit